MKLLFFAIVLSIFFIVGCTTNQEVGNANGTDSYENIRETAWNFLVEKDWTERAIEDWKTAEVEKIIARNNYAFLDENYDGKEVFAVSFEDKGKFVMGPPVILVDSDTNEVIGYILAE
ncbi:hypothetical protein PB01_15655 [Psychrobacillus glaciei]|uniref:DUF3887 domain-containing protein n=1 Tax=Psychrobacillus glaciei TaxID=2283160 RepID=A0A5J6ST10_9BACI|nr:hypothetical protein [Psychrobacillus glaciei]QFG01212.1 hypothetical protein PB01_15655 [Psychrobacillus glaciei]